MEPLPTNHQPAQAHPGNPSPCLEAALDYCGHGWSVIPLEGKRPHLLEWKPFQTLRPREEAIRWWYRSSWPHVGVGIVCGRVSGGLAVVDIDDPVLADRLIQNGISAVTRVVKTPRKGIHLYLQESHTNSRSGPLYVQRRHIGELRAAGNYVASPPSAGYTLLSDRPPLEVPDAKKWAYALLAQHGVNVDTTKAGVPAYTTLQERPLHIGERDATLASLAGLLRQKSFPNHVIEAALAGVNGHLCQPPLSAAQIQKIAQSIGSYPSGNGFDSAATTSTEATESKWQPAQALQTAQTEDIPWVWEGYLARGLTTLLSARAKIGKTTLLFHLLDALLKGQQRFLGARLAWAGKVLLLTEEPKPVLVKRLRRFGLFREDLLLIRQFDIRNWQEAMAQVSLAVKEAGVSLIIIDTLDKFWTVQDENDASAVIQALKPLQAICQEHQLAVLIHHHLRKMPGEEGTAHRGSGALVGVVDIALELYCDAAKTTRRRLKGLSRLEETPTEVIIELTDYGYTCLGAPVLVERNHLKTQVLALLPEGEEHAITYEEIRDRCDPKPGLTPVKEVISELVQERRIKQRGEGKRGDPYRFWKVVPVSEMHRPDQTTETARTAPPALPATGPDAEDQGRNPLEALNDDTPL